MVWAISLLRAAANRHRRVISPGMTRWWFFGMMSVVLTTAIWGYGNVVINQTEMNIAPGIVMWMRFAVAAIILAPALIGKKIALRDWLLGSGTGALLGISVLAQGLGMKTIPVDQVAFITGLYVVFTPIAVALLARRWPNPLVWAAVAVSLAGVVLLIGHLSWATHIGIVWSFLAALGFTGQIIGTGSLSKRVAPIPNAALQSVGAGIALTISTVGQGFARPQIFHGLFQWSTADWIGIGYLVIMAQVVAIWLQTWGQRHISATEAALTFNLEPAWTAMFAWIILAESMTGLQILGAVLVLGSLSLVSFPSKKGEYLH